MALARKAKQIKPRLCVTESITSNNTASKFVFADTVRPASKAPTRQAFGFLFLRVAMQRFRPRTASLFQEILMLQIALPSALALGLATSPFAPVRPTAAIAQDMPCTDLSTYKISVIARGGRWIDLTPEQWQFARGVAAEAPLTPAALPPGDRAALAQAPGEDSGTVLFIDGDRVCWPLPFAPNWVAMLREVGAGEIKHVGTDN
jgi:hypothetical protein